MTKFFSVATVPCMLFSSNINNKYSYIISVQLIQLMLSSEDQNSKTQFFKLEKNTGYRVLTTFFKLENWRHLPDN